MLLLKEEEDSLFSIVKCSAKNVAETRLGNECRLFLSDILSARHWKTLLKQVKSDFEKVKISEKFPIHESWLRLTFKCKPYGL